MRKRTVLVACGSFNPVTNMHLRMFELARDHLQNGLSPPVEVIGGLVSPVSDAYAKAGLVSASHRCAMLNLALLTNDWVRLDTWECSQEGWTETRRVLQHHLDALREGHQKRIDGAPHKRRRMDNLNGSDGDWPDSMPVLAEASPVSVMLLCGADLLQSFSVPGLWKDSDIEHLVSRFGLVVVSRPSFDAARFVYENDTLYRNRHNIHLVTEWMTNDISSTKVRRALARGESVKYVLQDSVIAYIQEHGLYRPQTGDNQDDSDGGQETAV